MASTLPQSFIWLAVALSSIHLLGCGTSSSDSNGAAGGSGGVPTIEAPACGGDGTPQVRIAGSVDSDPIDLQLTPGRIAGFDGTRLTWSSVAGGVSFSGMGALYLEDAPPVGQTKATRGLLRFADDGPRAGQFLCAGAGSVLRFDGSASVSATLRSLSLVGRCPGSPVSGSVEVCYSDAGYAAQAGCKTATIVSTLDGASFSEAIVLTSSLARPGVTTGVVDDGFGGGGTLLYELDALNHAAQGVSSAPVSSGYLVVPSGSADAGAVYCIEAGVADYRARGGGFEPLRTTFSKLSRVGTCGPPIAGELGICSFIADD